MNRNLSLHNPVGPTAKEIKKHDSAAQAQDQWVMEFFRKRSFVEEFGRSAVARAYDKTNPRHNDKGQKILVKRGSIGRAMSNLAAGDFPEIEITENRVESDNDGWEHTYKRIPKMSSSKEFTPSFFDGQIDSDRVKNHGGL